MAVNTKKSVWSQRLSEARAHLRLRGAAASRSNDILPVGQYPEIISMFEGSGLMRPWRGVEQAVANAVVDSRRFEPEAYFWNAVDPDLLKRLLHFFRTECAIPWAGENTLVIASGVSHLFDTFLGCVLSPGDLVLSPAPYYHQFAEYPEKWGAKWEVIPTSASACFKLTASELASFVQKHPQRERCRALVLTNPSVSGAVYSRHELEELSSAIIRLGLKVFVDEVYRDHVHQDTTFVSLASLPGMERVSVTAHSGSKTRGSADYRIGWACAPEAIAAKMISYLEFSINNVSRLTQIAGCAVLSTPSMSIAKGAAQCERRLGLIAKRLAALSNRLTTEFPRLWPQHSIVDISNVDGGHSIILDFTPLNGLRTPTGIKLNTSLDLCEYLMCPSQADQGVALSPCYSCGLDGMFLKLSFADVGHQYVSEVLRDGADFMINPACLNSSEGCSIMEACRCFNDQLDSAFLRGEDLIAEALRRLEVAIVYMLESNTRPFNHSFPVQMQDVAALDTII
ncbi:MAG: pyridoxal phosphate-dependent aminotransferase [Oligoflexia bacterium]|nr:pyridoxal phosphate-dependent aminotransferase [Oligoflexia bacterium]